MARNISWDDGYRLDLHQRILRKAGNLHRGACWSRAAEILRVYPVYSFKIIHIFQEDGCLHHIPERTVCCLKHSLKIGDGLAGLLAGIAAGEGPIGKKRHLSCGKDDVARADRLHIGADRRRSLIRINCDSFHGSADAEKIAAAPQWPST